MYKDHDMCIAHMRARMHVHAGVCVYDGHEAFRMAEMVHACIHVGMSCPSWGHVYLLCMCIVHACKHAICSHHVAMSKHHACLQLCVGIHVLVMQMLGQGMRCGDTWRGQHMWTKPGHVVTAGTCG